MRLDLEFDLASGLAPAFLLRAPPRAVLGLTSAALSFCPDVAALPLVQACHVAMGVES